jgi:hypothetical protein
MLCSNWETEYRRKNPCTRYMSRCVETPGKLRDLIASVYKSMHICDSPLSNAFFNVQNINGLQTSIQEIIKKETGHNIDRQSDRELVTIMKGVFEAFAQDTYTASATEVKRLNLVVLDIVIDQIKEGITSHLQYLQDASTLPDPLSRGTFQSKRGEKQLEMTYGFSS